MNSRIKTSRFHYLIYFFIIFQVALDGMFITDSPAGFYWGFFIGLIVVAFVEHHYWQKRFDRTHR